MTDQILLKELNLFMLRLKKKYEQKIRFKKYYYFKVPHLTTKEVCKEIPKEICVMKLVNPHPVQV